MRTPDVRALVHESLHHVPGGERLLGFKYGRGLVDSVEAVAMEVVQEVLREVVLFAATR